MGNIRNKQEIFRENLVDAGCDEDMIKECTALYDDDLQHALLKTLSKHRKHILNELHDNEKRLDCLDYLIFELREDTEVKQA